MVEYGRIQEELSGVDHMNEEKARNHQVDHQGFTCAPGDSWLVVRT